jgi:hypothetical protein
MIQIVLIHKTGRLISKRVKNICKENTYRYCNLKDDTDFENVHNFEKAGKRYEVYGKVNGRACTENKYEFPPPIDSRLFFGMMCVLKKDIESDEYENLSTMEWRLNYDSLFGGFHDLGSKDSEPSEDSEHDPEELTKDGYLKDGFVVDDNSWENDNDSDSDDEIEIDMNHVNLPHFDLKKFSEDINKILNSNSINMGNFHFNIEDYINLGPGMRRRTNVGSSAAQDDDSDDE